MKDSEVTTLALELADETARSDIEVCCCETRADGHRWYDLTRTPPEDEEWVARATRYLELRGLLIRHTQRPHLVRWGPSYAVEESA